MYRVNSRNGSAMVRAVSTISIVLVIIMIERVTVVKFRVNYGGGNGAGCFEVKVWADTAKFTDVIVEKQDSESAVI